jgi:hypothetical protein
MFMKFFIFQVYTITGINSLFKGGGRVSELKELLLSFI